MQLRTSANQKFTLSGTTSVRECNGTFKIGNKTDDTQQGKIVNVPIRSCFCKDPFNITTNTTGRKDKPDRFSANISCSETCYFVANVYRIDKQGPITWWQKDVHLTWKAFVILGEWLHYY